MREARRGSGSATFDAGGDEPGVLFELLSHPYRRFVVHLLDGVDDVMTVGEVATELAAWQTEFPVAERSATGVKEIEVALHHHHLPMLADAGLVTYEPSENVVEVIDSGVEVIDGDTVIKR